MRRNLLDVYLLGYMYYTTSRAFLDVDNRITKVFLSDLDTLTVV